MKKSLFILSLLILYSCSGKSFSGLTAKKDDVSKTLSNDTLPGGNPADANSTGTDGQNANAIFKTPQSIGQDVLKKLGIEQASAADGNAGAADVSCGDDAVMVGIYKNGQLMCRKHLPTPSKVNVFVSHDQSYYATGEWATIAGSNRPDLFCSIAGVDDDVGALATGGSQYKCRVHRDTDGFWKVQAPLSGDKLACRVMCVVLTIQP